MAAIEPLAIGVCSWALNVKSVKELRTLCNQLGVNVIQIACGDPFHAAWDDGDKMPEAALAAGFQMSGTMLGFPGEDYTTPQSIHATGGFGPKHLRQERLDRFAWALDRTKKLGLSDIMFHAGFVPEFSDDDFQPFLATLRKAADLADLRGIVCALETGQESSDHLLDFASELDRPNVRINFDPANLLLYDRDDPLPALRKIGHLVQSVHVKDAVRPTKKGDWGTEMPLGEGSVDMIDFIKTLRVINYRGPLCIERCVSDQQVAIRDVAHGVAVLKAALAAG
ncbi:MAG TPA: sugar phosphate isomerase/epimerase family protein [Gemmatales bacterium]|nr:sugar phosphate isomerase/epimerase family protein [Gemmatales bacterium]